METGTLGMLRGMLKRGRWAFPIRNDLMMDKVFLRQGHSWNKNIGAVRKLQKPRNDIKFLISSISFLNSSIVKD
jgi:hypothetical protein